MYLTSQPFEEAEKRTTGGSRSGTGGRKERASVKPPNHPTVDPTHGLPRVTTVTHGSLELLSPVAAGSI